MNIFKYDLNSVPVINGVYQFTDDAPIVTEGDGLKWLGYENVGENYRPNYFYNKDSDNVGNYINLAEFLGNDKIILDVGAGLGECAISFALSGLRAIAVDISQIMMEAAVKRARKHNVPEEKIIFARMNAYKLELEDNSVDAVLAMDVLHQVDRPELIVDEIKRVLKPEGYFLKYGGKNLGFTEEQQKANDYYNSVLKDIETFYYNHVSESDYRPFSSWEQADKCVKENFVEYKSIDDTGAFWADNIEWSLKLGLHKLKTRAAGGTQLIPDEVHNGAWAKTDGYAKNKYGEDYENISRFYNHTSGMVLYKMV